MTSMVRVSRDAWPRSDENSAAASTGSAWARESGGSVTVGGGREVLVVVVGLFGEPSDVAVTEVDATVVGLGPKVVEGEGVATVVGWAWPQEAINRSGPSPSAQNVRPGQRFGIDATDGYLPSVGRINRFPR